MTETTEDALPQILHDKATRGGILTGVERATLEAWYERQDAEESAQLAASAPASASLDELRVEVSEALTRLQEVTRRIQAQSAENQTLRRENAALFERLARSGSRQAA